VGNAFVLSLVDIADFVLMLLIYIITARVILSWIIRPNPYAQPNPVVQFLNAVTEPLLRPIRRIVPRLGPFDISPMVAILILVFIRIFMVRAVHVAF